MPTVVSNAANPPVARVSEVLDDVTDPRLRGVSIIAITSARVELDDAQAWGIMVQRS